MADAGYENFDLLVDRGPDGYQSHVVESPAGPASTTFAPLLVAARDPPDLGAALYGAAFGGEVDVCFRRSLDLARARGHGLRVRLRLAHDVPELAALPWELLYVPALDRFLVLSERTPLVRYLPVSEPVVPLDVPPPLHLLAVVSDPRDLPSLRVEREWWGLQRSLRPLQASGQIALHRLDPPTLPTLGAHLHAHTVHVLHFIGHGRYDPATDQGILAFEGQASEADCVPADTLGMLLHDHAPFRLAFLNACQGAQGAADDIYAGVAQRLVRQGIPAVIAMRAPVGDVSAIALAQTFYRALADSGAIDVALNRARIAVAALRQDAEWATPVLMSRCQENRLFRLPRSFDRLRFEPETVLVPAGPFCMGSAPGPGIPAHETPLHIVDLPAYRIGVYPVTNDQYAAFVRATGHSVHPHMGWQGKVPPPGRGQHPVMGVALEDAHAYCAWLRDQTGRAYALPNEAQWEKAARGTDGRAYPWGEAWDANRCHHGAPDTAPVDSCAPQSVYGCYDMAGNVSEWTCSLWGASMLRPDPPYAYRWADDGRNDPAANPYLYRVCRGGSAWDDPAGLRCSARAGRAPDDTMFPGAGFRIVLQEHQAD
ncbi:MAG: SUMF1/EgtB/PvdO family nonheme iron enzyme [Anaerolineae bacterium]|nr:SUMF1/EgtB/PvdO family nonheme iron enzyme [Anaerolineae bacterium]